MDLLPGMLSTRSDVTERPNSVGRTHSILGMAAHRIDPDRGRDPCVARAESIRLHREFVDTSGLGDTEGQRLAPPIGSQRYRSRWR
jgi:hypothetical protein